MTETIEFDVNGELRKLASDPTTSLLLALRNDLGLRGTRHGCATGYCGACTVLINGRPVTSCTTPVEAAQGQSVETIEAFEDEPIGRALFAAFIAEQAGQCGYCLSGILMRAKALLRDTPRPKRTDIAAALDENFCRCGAHQRILDAIERAAKELTEETSA